MNYQKDQVDQFLKKYEFDATRNFPGAQPVSYQQRHQELLQTQQTLVCEKTDGVRFFLLESTSNRFYLVDRKYAIRQVFVFNCEAHMS
jgi:hypothetical protein